MNNPYQSPSGHSENCNGDPRPDADPRTGEKGQAEISDPYELPDPEDYRPPDHPAYLIVVDQLRDWKPARSPSLAELLETRAARTRELEPDVEAEP